jgi:hypothetical protein
MLRQPHDQRFNSQRVAEISERKVDRQFDMSVIDGKVMPIGGRPVHDKQGQFGEVRIVRIGQEIGRRDDAPSRMPHADQPSARRW